MRSSRTTRTLGESRARRNGAALTVTFVSTNPDKAREVRHLLAREGIRVRWRRRRLPEPQADRLQEVVRSKLGAVRDLDGWVLVEDSGLFLPALGGFPGVYAAYAWRLWGARERFRPFFALLAGRRRTAIFRTVAGLQRGRRQWLFVGETRGTFADRPRGTHGFGYDPVFVPQGYRQTFGELSPAQKNALSHRGRAMRKVARFLLRTAAASGQGALAAGVPSRRPRGRRA